MPRAAQSPQAGGCVAGGHHSRPCTAPATSRVASTDSAAHAERRFVCVCVCSTRCPLRRAACRRYLRGATCQCKYDFPLADFAVLNFWADAETERPPPGGCRRAGEAMRRRVFSRLAGQPAYIQSAPHGVVPLPGGLGTFGLALRSTPRVARWLGVSLRARQALRSRHSLSTRRLGARSAIVAYRVVRPDRESPAS